MYYLEIIYALKDVTLYPYVVIIITFMEYQTRWQFIYGKYGEISILQYNCLKLIAE